MGSTAAALLRAYAYLGKGFLAPVLWYEQRQDRRAPLNERPVEYGFALGCLSRLCPRDVLDVGSGLSAWPRVLADCGFQVTAVDPGTEYWGRLFFNRHFPVRAEDVTRPGLAPGSFDLITCISVLEHIPEHEAATSAMLRLLRPGGHLVLSFPYCEGQYVSDVYRTPGAGYGRDHPYVCQIFSRAQVDAWLAGGRAALVEQEYHRIFEGELWTQGERLRPPRRVGVNERHQLSCLLVRKDGPAAGGNG